MIPESEHVNNTHSTLANNLSSSHHPSVAQEHVNYELNEHCEHSDFAINSLQSNSHQSSGANEHVKYELDEHDFSDIDNHRFSSECNCAVCLHLRVYDTGQYNFQNARIPVKTSLNIITWLQRLEDYHDNIICDFLQYGWPINYVDSSIPLYHYDTHPSAYAYSDSVEEYIQTELDYGAISGSYRTCPFNGCFVTSPLQTVPKDSTNHDKRRVVIDLSFPLDRSVNSGIPRDQYLGKDFQLSYPTVDTLAALIKKEGQGCYLFRLDLSRAYRQLPIDPYDYRLLGFHWHSEYYIDTRLPFGLASAAMACQRTTNAVTYILNKQGYPLVNYLDDFASARAQFSEAISMFYQLKQLLLELGLRESADKAVFPTQIMVFLGVLFNTITMTMEVTPDRLKQIQEEVSLWSVKKVFASKREIQSLIGKLQFVAKCVKPGRLFISRMLEVLRAIPHNSDKIRISREFRADLFWWKTFITQYNGVSVLGDTLFSEPGQIFQTDACLTHCGGLCGEECFSWPFPQFVLEQHIDINGLELLTIVVACKLWGQTWAGQRIIVQCDNEVSAKVINSGRSRSKFLNKYARELLYVAARCEYDIRASHIAGARNSAADQLSRDKLAEFRRQHPNMYFRGYNESLFSFQHDW